MKEIDERVYSYFINTIDFSRLKNQYPLSNYKNFQDREDILYLYTELCIPDYILGKFLKTNTRILRKKLGIETKTKKKLQRRIMSIT